MTRDVHLPRSRADASRPPRPRVRRSWSAPSRWTGPRSLCWTCCRPTGAARLGAPRRRPGRLGRAAGFDAAGPRPVRSDAERGGRSCVAHAVVRDEVGVPGTGLVCVRLVRVRRPTRASSAWSSRGRRRPPRRRHVGHHDPPRELAAPAARAGRPPSRAGRTTVAFTDGALSGADWRAVVAEAVERITAGELDKVVLARDLVADADAARSTCAGCCSGWPSATRPAGRSPSTGWSARPRSCWSAARGPGHLPGAGRHHPPHRRRRARPGAGRVAGAVVEGPRGARVRRPLGRRGARRRTARR